MASVCSRKNGPIKPRTDGSATIVLAVSNRSRWESGARNFFTVNWHPGFAALACSTASVTLSNSDEENSSKTGGPTTPIASPAGHSAVPSPCGVSTLFGAAGGRSLPPASIEPTGTNDSSPADGPPESLTATVLTSVPPAPDVHAATSDSTASASIQRRVTLDGSLRRRTCSEHARPMTGP